MVDAVSAVPRIDVFVNSYHSSLVSICLDAQNVVVLGSSTLNIVHHHIVEVVGVHAVVVTLIDVDADIATIRDEAV